MGSARNSKPGCCKTTATTQAVSENHSGTGAELAGLFATRCSGGVQVGWLQKWSLVLEGEVIDKEVEYDEFGERG